MNIANLPDVIDERFKTIAGRMLWGCLGGLIATISKFLAQDLHWLRIYDATRDYGAMHGMIVTYIVLLICLCIIGLIVAAAFQGERHPMKLLALGVAAPALVTTWLGGQYPGSQGNGDKQSALAVPFLTAAYAADFKTADFKDSDAKENKDFWRGVGTVFGFGKDQSKYRVVVGSFPTRSEATQMLEKVHKARPGLNVFTADPKPNNSFYGVIIGNELPFQEAVKLRDEISEEIGVKDAYLSRYQ